jgi:hypothetical protein
MGENSPNLVTLTGSVGHTCKNTKHTFSVLIGIGVQGHFFLKLYTSKLVKYLSPLSYKIIVILQEKNIFDYHFFQLANCGSQINDEAHRPFVCNHLPLTSFKGYLQETLILCRTTQNSVVRH